MQALRARAPLVGGLLSVAAASIAVCKRNNSSGADVSCTPCTHNAGGQRACTCYNGYQATLAGKHAVPLASVRMAGSEGGNIGSAWLGIEAAEQ